MSWIQAIVRSGPQPLADAAEAADVGEEDRHLGVAPLEQVRIAL